MHSHLLRLKNIVYQDLQQLLVQAMPDPRRVQMLARQAAWLELMHAANQMLAGDPNIRISIISIASLTGIAGLCEDINSHASYQEILEQLQKQIDGWKDLLVYSRDNLDSFKQGEYDYVLAAFEGSFTLSGGRISQEKLTGMTLGEVVALATNNGIKIEVWPTRSVEQLKETLEGAMTRDLVLKAAENEAACPTTTAAPCAKSAPSEPSPPPAG